jgi:hypothetical protein
VLSLSMRGGMNVTSLKFTPRSDFGKAAGNLNLIPIHY